MRSNFRASQGNGQVGATGGKLWQLRILAGGVASAVVAAPALAHTSGRGLIMLLPTNYYVFGGASAVLASILLMALLPGRAIGGAGREWPLGAVPRWLGIVPSLASFAFIVMLIAAGFLGPFDPIANPLPGFIWTLWWVGFTCLCMILGNLWPVLNPWTGVTRLVAGVRGAERPLLRYPAWLGYWPAIVMFLGFAWLELVDPAPEDPPHLAMAVATYLVLNFAGALLFGERDWLGKAEAFSAYFRLIGRLSPLQWRGDQATLKLCIGLPGYGLLETGATGISAAAFVLLTLATVSFDGLSRTFFWAGLLGLNPLEFPGRSAVVFANTAGLSLMFAGLASAYALAILVSRFAGVAGRLPSLVLSIVPIAIAYHIAHYLPDFPVAAMRALKALSDPFGSGRDFLGMGSLAPPASQMMDYRVAELVYRLQTAFIVVGHVAAVAIAHLRTIAAGVNRRDTLLIQAPLNVLMVLYTVFGLWLLSTPVIS